MISTLRLTRLAVLAIAVTALLSLGVAPASARSLTPIERLGKKLLFDTNLSSPRGQSCATCHAPSVGYTSPSSRVNLVTAVHPGAVSSRFGNRKPPSAAYGGDSPVLHYNPTDASVGGGSFWDGRATGWTLGDPLAEQAKGPFLNPLEQNVSSERAVCVKVAKSKYRKLFQEVWGKRSVRPYADTARMYDRIARSIAAYERSPEMNPFNSKFDAFYKRAKRSGKTVSAIDVTNWTAYRGLGLCDSELYGFAVFNDESKGKCALCHTLDEGSAGYPMFTDYTYDNLGIPKNPANPFYFMPAQFNSDGARVGRSGTRRVPEECRLRLNHLRARAGQAQGPVAP